MQLLTWVQLLQSAQAILYINHHPSRAEQEAAKGCDAEGKKEKKNACEGGGL
ncbi:hypothetical protein PGT21_008528 [Puccinia graminis f. sp. tritici]|uniref:Uncharacterized protein n=1 Tax=Puccinia graminis f. sp. tritici TaxID=56615 RepID=A0A5B0REF4_PUCGR|nr:hypothetical protein PGT21_008528 [Puccinia graminis f. sp. tritici]KAA1123275.1 hypothetical protein PGTUg99_018653 [Puccinia graminis f. sp. tritici]